MATKQLTKPQILKFFTTLAKNNPNPTTELKYSNNYQLLIAVVLSAQATDISVNKVTKELFKDVKKPEDLLKFNITQVKSKIKSIGLYQNKAKNIFALSKILVEQHNSKVPNTREELEKLPGVGRKTANVILNTAFKIPVIAVDTHIFRVANRTGITLGRTPREVEVGLMKVIPQNFKLNAHHWLILHGRYVCVARKPKCSNCSVLKICCFNNKTII